MLAVAPTVLTGVQIKLTYFDVDGGRAEPARLALSMGGVPFEDERIKGSEWAARKPSTPFGSLPVMEVDGTTVSQCNAINHFVGQLTDLYPKDPRQALLCDQVLEVMEEADHKIGPTLFVRDEEEKKRLRTALAEGPLTRILQGLARQLEAAGGEYFADARLTVADLKVFVGVRYLRSGIFDHVPTDLVDKVAPSLVAHFERVNGHPGVRGYYAARGK